jgi:hypothetical protein
MIFKLRIVSQDRKRFVLEIFSVEELDALEDTVFVDVVVPLDPV